MRLVKAQDKIRSERKSKLEAPRSSIVDDPGSGMNPYTNSISKDPATFPLCKCEGMRFSEFNNIEFTENV